MIDEVEVHSPFEPVEPVAAVAETAEAPPVPTSIIARLVVKRSGAETDIEYSITAPATIGRFDPAVGPIDVDLAGLPEGSYVSRKHAKITYDDGVWKLHDLGSSNGTFLLRGDFERVDEAELSDGQEFALGNARFVFHLQ
jgi:pSer/pThr/pTyr-binding forkhead associated (FHA) protein